MQCINDWILVEFDMDHNKKFGSFIRPDLWLHEEINGQEKFDINRNKRETNPQIATVISDNPGFIFQKGDKIFVHFLAIDTAEGAIDFENKKCHFIRKSQIFFRINTDGTYDMVPDTFLGKQVYSEAIKTESGIYITPWTEKKEALQVEITHAPYDRFVKIGDKIISYDDNQYEIEVDGEKYIKITSEWIPAKIKDGKLIAV